jgi:hypothetical protein
MAFQALGQSQQPVPLSLQCSQIDINDIGCWMTLIDQSGSLIVDIVELPFADLDLVKTLNNGYFNVLNEEVFSRHLVLPLFFLYFHYYTILQSKKHMLTLIKGERSVTCFYHKPKLILLRLMRESVC